jgi:hypothetical protein
MHAMTAGTRISLDNHFDRVAAHIQDAAKKP